MYTYRNKKTGSFFTSSCVCKGKDWEEVKASASKTASVPKAKGGKKQESAADAETADSDTEDS